MEESKTRSAVVQALHSLHGVAIENRGVGVGTPDVNYLNGWIEVKLAEAWPKKEKTALQLRHFTPQQRAFLRTRHHIGGAAWLLLQVGHEYLLLSGDWASRNINRATRTELLDAAVCVWVCRADMQRELARTLIVHDMINKRNQETKSNENSEHDRESDADGGGEGVSPSHVNQRA